MAGLPAVTAQAGCGHREKTVIRVQIRVAVFLEGEATMAAEGLREVGDEGSNEG